MHSKLGGSYKRWKLPEMESISAWSQTWRTWKLPEMGSENLDGQYGSKLLQMILRTQNHLMLCLHLTVSTRLCNGLCKVRGPELHAAGPEEESQIAESSQSSG